MKKSKRGGKSGRQPGNMAIAGKYKTWRTAGDIAESVRAGTLTAADAVAGARDRIALLDDRLNAFLAMSDTAEAEAARIDARQEKDGVLRGVPVAIKDLTDTAGLVTTHGSAAFRDHVPSVDDLVVARLRAAGAIIIGKTMTPEFGFGAICANPLGPATCNPWNLALTSGSSSGGSAAAVASGMVPLAHGTDFGGSVRTPASFCGVLSLRPTPGMIPAPTRGLAFDTLATHGVLARSVDDLELFLDAVAGPDPRDPTSSRWTSRRDETFADPLRIAATEDFGMAPVAGAVRGAMRAAARKVARTLAPVNWTHPDCTGAIEAFHALRQPIIRHGYGALLEKHGDVLTPTVRWAISRGDGVTAANYLAAEAHRSALYRRFVAFFGEHDILLAPAASVLPWPNTVPDVTEIDGRPLATVIDYLAVTFIVSLVGCPVVTLPAWTAGEVPFGIQLIGAPGSDRRLLAAARLFESSCGFAFRAPPLESWSGA